MAQNRGEPERLSPVQSSSMFLFWFKSQSQMWDRSSPVAPWNPWIHPSFDGVKEFSVGFLAPRYPYAMHAFQVADPTYTYKRAMYQVQGMHDSFKDRKKDHRIFSPPITELAKLVAGGNLTTPVDLVALSKDLNSNRFPVPTKVGKWATRMVHGLVGMPFDQVPQYLIELYEISSTPVGIPGQPAFKLDLAFIDMNDLNPLALPPPAKVVDLPTSCWYHTVLPVDQKPVEEIIEFLPTMALHSYVSMQGNEKMIYRRTDFAKLKRMKEEQAQDELARLKRMEEEQAQDELAGSLWGPSP